MSKLTMTDRQVRGIYGLVQALNRTGGRLALESGTDPERDLLSAGEMHQLERRMYEYLVPRLDDAEVEVEVVKS